MNIKINTMNFEEYNKVRVIKWFLEEQRYFSNLKSVLIRIRSERGSTRIADLNRVIALLNYVDSFKQRFTIVLYKTGELEDFERWRSNPQDNFNFRNLEQIEPDARSLVNLFLKTLKVVLDTDWQGDVSSLLEELQKYDESGELPYECDEIVSKVRDQVLEVEQEFEELSRIFEGFQVKYKSPEFI